MNKLTFHKSNETLPIFAYYKLMQTNDLRYLIANIDYNNLPEIVEEKDLQNAYNEYFKTIKEVDCLLSGYYLKALTYYFDYLNDKSLINKVNDSWNIYFKELTAKYKNFNLDGIIYEEGKELYLFIKSKFDYYKLLEVRLIYFDYRRIISEKKSNLNFDLYNSLVFINNVLNVNLNEFETSVDKFNVFLEKAILKAKSNGKN